MRLNESNFILFAAKYYDNPNCISADEFLEDLNRIKYIKKLFHSYKNKGVIKERLILNHIVILYNVFEPQACTRMLFLKLDGYYSYLAPFLMYLGYLPDVITHVGDADIYPETIPWDQNIMETLKELDKNARS